jgi:hypothetical protein
LLETTVSSLAQALAKSEWLKLTEYRQRYNIRAVSLDGSYFDINPGFVKDDRCACLMTCVLLLCT